MAEDFIMGLKAQSILLLGGLLLVFLAKMALGKMYSPKVKYSQIDGETADVYVFRLLKWKEGYYKFIFHRSIGDSWKYERNYVGLKNRILLFVLGYAVNMGIWVLQNDDPIVPAVYLICALYWGGIAFVTMITDPLEAYFILQKDQREKSGLKKDIVHGSSSDAVIIDFLQAIADCDEEKIRLCLPEKCDVSKEMQTEIDKLFEITKRNQDFGVIIPHYEISLKLDINPELLETSNIPAGDIEEAILYYVNVSFIKSENGNNCELIKDSYHVETYRCNNKWYIGEFYCINVEGIVQE